MGWKAPAQSMSSSRHQRAAPSGLKGPSAPPLVEMERPGAVDQLHSDLPAQPRGQARQRRTAFAQRAAGIEVPEQRRPAIDGDGPRGLGMAATVGSVLWALSKGSSDRP
jgi:hypothetical protein